MTSRVGMLQWVPNTLPLKALLEEEMKLEPPHGQLRAMNSAAYSNGSAESFDIHQLEAAKYQFQLVKHNHQYQNYHSRYSSSTVTSTYEEYSKMISTIPSNLIRRRLLRKANSPEAFFTQRQEFAKTLAVSSVFGYILGIGDRHLENLLFDTNSGAIVQIDFGMCFGISTSVLQVPELIPFRLTPQLRGVLQPLDGEGMLRHYMVQTMTALRSAGGYRTLAHALEIYINDPIADWVSPSSLHREGIADEDLTALRNSAQWEPRKKVLQAMKKLRGVTPGQLMLELLQSNPWVKAQRSYSALKRLVEAALKVKLNKEQQATRQASVKVEGGGEGVGDEDLLSAGDQVAALLELATSPAILAIQWAGLALWL